MFRQRMIGQSNGWLRRIGLLLLTGALLFIPLGKGIYAQNGSKNKEKKTTPTRPVKPPNSKQNNQRPVPAPVAPNKIDKANP